MEIFEETVYLGQLKAPGNNTKIEVKRRMFKNSGFSKNI